MPGRIWAPKMPEEKDTAAILYPDDVPAQPSAAADWFNAERDGAEARLLGRADDSAKAEGDPDTAETLYEQDQPPFDDAGATSFFDGERIKAMQDGEEDRSQELLDAGKALVENMKAAGTSSADFDEALAIVNERAYEAMTDDQRQQQHDEVIASLQAEYSSPETLQADLKAARAFVRDLDLIAPGTIRSLQMSGAGNDPRLIRKAIKEARRRGYGS